MKSKQRILFGCYAMILAIIGDYLLGYGTIGTTSDPDAYMGISIRGIFAFINRGFPGYMTAKVAFAFFDYSEPRVFFFFDYVAVMILFMMIGFGCFSILAKEDK